jgi:hypothetical protein
MLPYNYEDANEWIDTDYTETGGTETHPFSDVAFSSHEKLT